ncbi:condensin complex subunit 1-like [Haemaphysalis longicornis]
MADFEYVLPLSKEGLLRAEKVGQFYVKDVVPAREIGAQLRGFLSKKKSLDIQCIVDSFDLLYSVITAFHSLDGKVIQDAFDLALLCVSQAESELSVLLKDAEANLSPQAKKQSQNHLKMSCYLLCHLMDLTEAESRRPTGDAGMGTAKGRKKALANNMKFLEWGNQKQKAVQCLKNIYELPLQCLWSPQPVEEEFVNLVADCFFRLIEDPSNAKSAFIKDAFTIVIGLSCKRHSYSIGCVMKIVQVVQAQEHVAAFLADTLRVFSEKYGVKGAVGDCIRELCRLDSLETAQDCGGLRNVASFFVELTEHMPETVMKSVSLLVDLLNVKSYAIRNGVLTVFCKLVLVVLSKEGLDDKEKELRDTLLEHLEDHMLDENAFVRSKVLQLWQEMCHRNLIPLDRQQTLLSAVANRLLDRSSVVRKHAIGFVSAYLANNPFIAKLTPQELRKNLAEEEEKLRALRIVFKDQDGEEGVPEEKAADASWMGVLPNLEEVLEEDCEKDKDTSLEDSELVLLDEVLHKIRALLKSGSFTEAVAVLKKAMVAYPDVNLFCRPNVGENGVSDDKDIENGENGDTKPVLLDVLKKIYQGNKDVAEPPPAKNKKPSSELPPNGFHCDGDIVELHKQKMLVLYLRDCVGFAECIEEMIPTLCDLLFSRTQSDVHEAIAFFVSAHHLGIRSAMVGIRRMLPLVWAREPATREAVANSYRDVYFNQPATNAKTRARNITDGLSELAITASPSELICLEQLVTELVKTGDVSPMVVRFLWERYKMEQPDTTRDQYLAAAQLLCMVASADITMVQKNLDVLISVGFGERGKADLDLVRLTCKIIEKLTHSGSLDKPPVQRLEGDHDMFIRLKDILVETFTDTSISIWSPTMEKVLDIVYKMSKQPSQFADDLLFTLAERIISLSQQREVNEDTKELAETTDAVERVKLEKVEDEEGSSYQQESSDIRETPESPQQQAMEDGEECSKRESDDVAETPDSREEQSTKCEESSEQPQQQSDGSEASSKKTPKLPKMDDVVEDASVQCPSVVLSRALACVGHMALRQLIYLDVDVFSQLKRRRNNAKDSKERHSKRNKRKSLSALSLGHSQSQGHAAQEEQSGENPDEEMTGPVTEDADAEYIVHLLDNVVLGEDSPLRFWAELVIRVLREEETYTDPGLRTVASLALAKLMLINAAFCEQHLTVLFNLLEHSPDPQIRCNLVVAVGDLVVRFPNLLYNWTEKIYARLHDPERQVKMSALKTVSFLILNDMIKVKGQISDIAVMVMDEDTEVADMCRSFFLELGTKGNALYNLLPDIISHLTDDEHGIDEESFHAVMKLLFSCVNKEKDLENFVEKLCFRFLTMTSERQWRDLAYCMSLIPYGERGIKKLYENIVCFGDKLQVDAVYESIMSIISGAKKVQTMKPETKILIQEFEDLVEELHSKGISEGELAQRTKKSVATPKSATKRGGKTPSATPRNTGTQSKRRRRRMSPISESEEEDVEATPAPPTTRKNLPRRQCKVQIKFSDSSEDDEKDS